MLKHASDIIFKNRLPVLLLALLSLVSSVSYIVPGDICLQYPHESLQHENESPEACKVPPGIETPARNKRVFHQVSSVDGQTAAVHNTGADYPQLTCWARPAYYEFLHRFNLF
ncbi:hypothetical protein ACFOTA_21420 [Chitinophaga sp. GCM10012297]|uniref:Uncharacterized protein n=1 Tax=Chitinophaga chungangae TaxID=2821488 RepID=A0ABS3YJC1_9BACT|nr:hypothetical protein [Chitinophaga chungangae]MBO9154788.1 hypothetical protein [Chitinophaga chungangae]